MVPTRPQSGFSLVEPKQSEVPTKAGIHLQRGFSLVELSIVLVILGLLVGGVLAGQSLIRAAEMRSVSTDIGRYQAAVQTFKDKYLAIPGDMSNAVAFWGRHPATTSDNSLTWNVSESIAWEAAASTTATNNGNGNGYHDDWTGVEALLAWQHLSNAGLISGQFKGGRAGGSGSVTSLPGTHVPPSKLGIRGGAARTPATGKWP